MRFWIGAKNGTVSVLVALAATFGSPGTGMAQDARDPASLFQSRLCLIIAGVIVLAMILVSQLRKRQGHSPRNRSAIDPLSASAAAEAGTELESLPATEAPPLRSEAQTSATNPLQKSQPDPSEASRGSTKEAPLRAGVKFANRFALGTLAMGTLAIGIIIGLSYVTFSIGASSHVSAGSLKVWTQEVYLDPTATKPVLVLNIQSRTDTPVVLMGVSVNDDPKCFPEYGLGSSERAVNVMNGIVQIMLKSQGINILRAGYSKELKLGEIEKLSLGSPSFGGCTPVKVVINTDHGSATFNFE